MKKLFAFVALFVCLLGLAGCTTKVSGKTFVYENLEIKFTENVSEEYQKGIKDALVKLNENTSITFKAEDEGTVWTQDGKTVTYGEIVYTAKGGKLIHSLDVSDLDIKILFVEIKLSEYVTSVKVTYKESK